MLVCADALGTIPFFCAPGERLGVHPLLRLRPPRALRRVFPEHVLTGHGDGVHEDASAALHEALRTSRRRLPAALRNVFRQRLAFSALAAGGGDDAFDRVDELLRALGGRR